MLHHVRLDKRQPRPGLKRKKIHREVEGRHVGQQCLKPRVRIAEERHALDLSGVSKYRSRPRHVLEFVVEFLENHHPRPRVRLRDFQVRIRRRKRKPARLERLRVLVRADHARPVHHIDERLNFPGLELRMPARLERDQQLRQIRPDRRRDEHIHLRAGNARQHAGHAAIRRDERMPVRHPRARLAVRKLHHRTD